MKLRARLAIFAKMKIYQRVQVLAWNDGGWEKDSEDIEDFEEKEFLVCSSNEDGDNILILGTPMEQEDALITCQVEKITRQMSNKGKSHCGIFQHIRTILDYFQTAFRMSCRFYKGQALTSRI